MEERANIQPTTTRRRGLLSLAAGAAVGGILVAAPYLAGRIAQLGGIALGATVIWTLVVFAAASIVWAFGLLALGAPVWWLMHRHGQRGWLSATCLGFALPFLVALGFSAIQVRPPAGGSSSTADGGGLTSVNGVLTAHGWVAAIEGAAILGLGGVVVALVVRAIAYPRAKSSS